MTDVEMALCHRTIRDELCKLCWECIKDLSQRDPLQAAAFMAAIGMNKYELTTEVKLLGANTDLKICLEDKLGGKHVVFHFPIFDEDGGTEQ